MKHKILILLITTFLINTSVFARNDLTFILKNKDTNSKISGELKVQYKAAADLIILTSPDFNSGKKRIYKLLDRECTELVANYKRVNICKIEFVNFDSNTIITLNTGATNSDLTVSYTDGVSVYEEFAWVRNE